MEYVQDLKMWDYFSVKCNFEVAQFSFLKKDFPLSWSRKLFVLLALRKAGALSFSVFLSSCTCSDCVTAGVETCQMGVCTNVYNPINYKDTQKYCGKVPSEWNIWGSFETLTYVSCCSSCI